MEIRKSKRTKAEEIIRQSNKSLDLMLSEMLLLFENEVRELNPDFHKISMMWRSYHRNEFGEENARLIQRKFENLKVGSKIKIAIYDCCEGIAVVRQMNKDNNSMEIEFLEDPTLCYEHTHLESLKMEVALDEIFEFDSLEEKPESEKEKDLRKEIIGKHIYEGTIVIKKERLEFINKLLGMTGEQIYQTYGLKRDETITETYSFFNGIEADIKLVICEDDVPYTEGVLFRNGFEILHTECEDTFDGEWYLETNDAIYKVNVVTE